MTREEAADELLSRLEHQIVWNHVDFCIGEKSIRFIIEQFRKNAPIEDGP